MAATMRTAATLLLLVAPLVANAAARPCNYSLRRPLCSLSCALRVGRCRGGMQRAPAVSEPPDDWQMVHLYDDGHESHWGTETFPFATSSGVGRMTARLPCEGVWLRWTAGAYDDCHNAPRRQIIASLNGHVEATVGSGERRRFGPGDVLLVEDTRGAGHCTRSLDGVGRWSVFVALGGTGRLSWLWARPTTRELVLLALLSLAATRLAWRRLLRAGNAENAGRRGKS